MQIFLYILLIFGLIILFLLTLAAFTKKSYSIERNISINKSREIVFDYLRFLKNQDYFSKWVMTDPQMKKSFKGTDGTEGFVYAWDGNKKAGKGEQEIMQIIPDERIDVEVRFERPFKALAYTPFSIKSPANDQSIVSWSMNSTMKYPMNIMLVFMDMDKLLGKDMEESLGNLKIILEKNN